MKAKFLALTHFSLNNTIFSIKKDISLNTGKYISGNIEIDEFINKNTAFCCDYMKINDILIPHLPEISR